MAIEETIRRHGGVMSKEDLAAHRTTFEDPVSSVLWDDEVEVVECAPNGQGLVALMALNICECFDWKKLSEAQQWHVQIEAVRLAFADASYHLCDPSFETKAMSVSAMLSKEYARKRASLISLEKAGSFERGDANRSSVSNGSSRGASAAAASRCGRALYSIPTINWETRAPALGVCSLAGANAART